MNIVLRQTEQCYVEVPIKLKLYENEYNLFWDLRTNILTKFAAEAPCKVYKNSYVNFDNGSMKKFDQITGIQYRLSRKDIFILRIEEDILPKIKPLIFEQLVFVQQKFFIAQVFKR